MILFPSNFPKSTGRNSQNHEEQNHGETVNGGPATITKCVAHSDGLERLSNVILAFPLVHRTDSLACRWPQNRSGAADRRDPS